MKSPRANNRSGTTILILMIVMAVDCHWIGTEMDVPYMNYRDCLLPGIHILI